MCVHACLLVCVYVCVCTYVCMGTCVHVVYVHVCMHACGVCVCVLVCVPLSRHTCNPLLKIALKNASNKIHRYKGSQEYWDRVVPMNCPQSSELGQRVLWLESGALQLHWQSGRMTLPHWLSATTPGCGFAQLPSSLHAFGSLSYQGDKLSPIWASSLSFSLKPAKIDDSFLTHSLHGCIQWLADHQHALLWLRV